MLRSINVHIPDGFLSAPVWAGLGACSAASIGVLSRRAQARIDEGRVPLMGVMGAFIFAAQMINFPVAAGTSSHLVGGTLLAVTLGPVAAAIVMAAVLTVQALIFQDGGVLALGANIVNMALAGVAAGYLPYYFLGARWKRLALLLGGFASVMMSSCLALAELKLSHVPMPTTVLWVSLAIFAASAIAEGVITMAIVPALIKINPNWVREPQVRTSRIRFAIALAAVVLASASAFVASSQPDGIGRLAISLGIDGQVYDLVTTPFQGYEWQTGSAAWTRKLVAGFAGLAFIYGSITVLGRLLVSRRSG